jgi:hypothetical protein
MFAPSMFFIGFVIGLFFAAIFHHNRALLIDVNTAALALVPIWLIGSLLFMRDIEAALFSTALVFLALGVGFLLVGVAAGSVTGFAMTKILRRRKSIGRRTAL